MRTWLTMLAVIGLAMPALASAEEPESRETLIGREMDRYLRAPGSAATYRALAGMGDPAFMGGEPPFEGGWDSRFLQVLGVNSWTDCRWRYSEKVYRARIERFGENHPYVQQWLKVQRAVFSRCERWESKGNEPIPAPLAVVDELAARLQKQDRAYQIAAALFYENRIAEARVRFAAIARTPGEHQAAAKLMLASIDAGSTPDTYRPAAPAKGSLAAAERLLKDPSAKPMQASAHELVGWIGATRDTKEARAAQVKVTLEALALPLSAIQTDAQARQRYFRAAEDLPALFAASDPPDWWLTGAVPDGYYGSLAMAAAARTNPMAAFALTEASLAHDRGGIWSVLVAAQGQYQAGRPDRDAWRVVLLEQESSYERPDPTWTEIDTLIARVGTKPTDHDVALLAFLFEHKIKTAFAGSYDAAENRKARSQAISKLAAYPYKGSDHFRRLYGEGLVSLVLFKDIEAARRLRDLVEPRLTDRGGVDSNMMLLLAGDETEAIKAVKDYGNSASTLLNRLPVQSLERWSSDDRFEPKVRARLARVALTRYFVLGNRIPKNLDVRMRTLNPAIGKSWTSKLGARAGDHALLLDVLGTPGMNLRVESRSYEEANPLELDYYEHSLNNWWCSPDAVEQTGREEDALSSSFPNVSRGTLETLLSKSYIWRSLDVRERERLGTVPKAPEFLSNAAIRWGGKANARKPKGADEALALAVRSTRYGCQMQGGHGAYSRAAWELLHGKFPDGAPATRTRWWFDCSHFTYGCPDNGNDDQGSASLEQYEEKIDTPPSEETALPGTNAVEEAGQGRTAD